MMQLSRKARRMATKETSPQVQHCHIDVGDGNMSAIRKQWRFLGVWMESFLFAGRYLNHPMVCQSEIASLVKFRRADNGDGLW